MRVAIIASPRTGQTWLRRVLWHAWGFPVIAVHNWIEVPSELPTDCLFGIHWPREPNFLNWLGERGFRTVTLARHPLDVLVSALHFVRHEPQTCRWLEGLTGLPEGLAGESPTSSGFLDYALSFGAETLLSVTYQWWHDPSTMRLKYEDLVHAPEENLIVLSAALGIPARDFTSALRANTVDVLRPFHVHGWQGRPGLWRELVPWLAARRIHARHRNVFEALGYRVTPNLLTRAAAERNWQRLKVDEVPCAEPSPSS
jgi:hypothetical protein